MNFFLKSRTDIDNSTNFLEDNGLVQSGISAKNWEVTQVVPYMKDGNWCDLGADGGVVLENLVKKNIVGQKVGIDLAYVESGSRNGIDYIKGDLMNVPLPDGYFNFITSLSVIEHEVNYERFAKEVSRLLQKDGELFVSFDYSPEKIDTSLTKLYSLSWNILSQADVLMLVDVCGQNGLKLVGEIDWATQDMVINPQYCSPANCSYTFGIFHFKKQ